MRAMSAAPVSDEGAVDLDAAAAPDRAQGRGPDGGPDGAQGEDGDASAPGAGDRAGLRERLTRWPAAAPWWVRGPGAVLAAAALAAVVVGALGAHQARAQLQERVAARTAVLQLSVGAAEVEGSLEGSGTSVRGGARDDAQLAVTLVNRADEPVLVQLGELHVPEQIATGAARPVEVDAQSTAVVTLPLQDGCADLPPGTGLAGAWDASLVGTSGVLPVVPGPEEWLTATVVSTAAGGGEEDAEPVRLPVVSPSLGGSVGQQLLWACRMLGPEAVYASPVEVLDDGRLVVRARNDSSQTMLLIPRDALGTALVSDPPLPLRLEPGSTEDLALALRVDCEQVGTVLWQSYGGSTDLLVSADDGNPTVDDGGYSVLGDPAVTAAWATRLVGAACGPSPASLAP